MLQDDEEVSVKHVFAFALPSRVMMVRIMRACLAIEDKSELWIFNDHLENITEEEIVESVSTPKASKNDKE